MYIHHWGPIIVKDASFGTKKIASPKRIFTRHERKRVGYEGGLDDLHPKWAPII